mgnify:CR=1 FL=1
MNDTIKTPALTSDKTRAWYQKNNFGPCPELAKDSVPPMLAHIDAQKKRRAGPPTTGKFGQVEYLLAHGWTRAQVSLMTFAEASKLIYKSKLAKGTLKTA